jgi:hypothetical protein
MVCAIRTIGHGRAAAEPRCDPVHLAERPAAAAVVKLDDRAGLHRERHRKWSRSAHLNTGAILIAIYLRALGRVHHIPEGTLPNHCILGGNYKEAGTPEGIFRYRRMLVGRLSDRTPEGMLRYHYIQGDKLRDRQRALRLT